jgi:hypothetical protein
MTRTLIIILASLILVGCTQTRTETPLYIVAVENVYGVIEKHKNPNSTNNPWYTRQTYDVSKINETRKAAYQACFDPWENTKIGEFTNLGHGCIETRYTDETNKFIPTYLANRSSFDLSYSKKFNEIYAYLDKEDKKRQSLVEEKKREEQDRVRKNMLASLELKYAGQCKKFKKDTPDFDKCLVDEQKKASLEQDRIKNLPPSERYAYTCEKTYGFRKGTDNFKECVFKIMTTEYEMQNQLNQRRIAELERKVASNQANTAYQNEMLEIERMKAKAMQDQVNFARNKDVTDTLLGISNNLLNPPRKPAPNAPQMFNCQTRKFGGFDQIQCF